MTVELQSVALGHEGHVSTPSFLRQFPRVPPLITCSHVNRKRQTLSWIRPSAGLKSLTTAADTLSSIVGGPAFPQTAMSVRNGFSFSRP